MLTQMQVFYVLVGLGALWTVVWGWVLIGSRKDLSYDQLTPTVARLRRTLLYLFSAALLTVFVVSMYWLPYPQVRRLIYGRPRLTIAVTADQWNFRLDRSEVPMGVPVEFDVTSVDVNHGFGLYSPADRLIAQVQAMPGYTNRLIFTFRQPGTYTIRCLEYCGMPHFAMVAHVTVESAQARKS